MVDSADRPNTTPSASVVAVLEFSAADPAQSLANALVDSVPVRTLVLDLIAVGYGRETDLDRRAELVADDIVNSGATVVALAASCAASPILAPTARHLRRRAVSVPVAATVDPGPVTPGHIRYTIGRIVAGLGVATPDDRIEGLDLNGPAGESLARIEVILRDGIERFLASSSPMDAVDQELVRSDLMDRYLRWSAFLLAAMQAPAQDPACRVDVFLTGSPSDPVAMFGSETAVRHHRYPHRDSAALDREDLLDDLRTILTSAVGA